MSREFVLIGDPVAHSRSPLIHRAAFSQWDIDATYAVRRVPVADLAREVRGIASRGGGNVTLPHKGAVAALIDEPTDDVRATGACNCFWGLSDGGVAGDNTDVGGFAAAVTAVLPDLEGAEVLVLGAGGGARAVVHALLGLGASTIRLTNRTIERARALADDFDGGVDVVRTADDAPADLLVNATRLGLSPADPLPFDFATAPVGAVFDLVYAPGETALVRAARARGIPAVDGLPMLVHQAALSLKRWFPDLEPPMEVLFSAARGDDA